MITINRDLGNVDIGEWSESIDKRSNVSAVATSVIHYASLGDRASIQYTPKTLARHVMVPLVDAAV